MDIKMYWHNFKAGKDELIDTSVDFKDYILQEPAAQNLYKLYVEQMGLAPIEAAIKVLEAMTGKADKPTKLELFIARFCN